MAETRVKIQSIVENQLPDFIREDAPLLGEFLKQYYISQEYQGAPADLLQNIDEYIKINKILQSIDSTTLQDDISYSDTSIRVTGQTLTEGFPSRYGILKINDEIITYTSKTSNSFEGCVRGFSGVTSYSKLRESDELVFSTSNIDEHESGATIYNLSGLFLNQFLTKIKRQFLPGFSERSLDSDLNQNVFIKQSSNFYSSKGTDESFKILFGALYGERVEVIKPKEYLFRPSDAGYRRTKDLVVEALSGDPLDLLNNTLYQDEYSNYNITNSYASVTDVEKLYRDGREYYKLSFDADYNKDLVLDGTLYGNFSVHPKTKVVTKVSSASTVIDVDSTVGFPTTGTLITTSVSGGEVSVAYTGKSLTQFFNVSGISTDINSATNIRLDVYAYGYSGITTDSQIQVRIGSVLDEVVIPEKTYLFSKNDSSRIQTLGVSGVNNSWLDNVSNTFKVNSISLQNSINFTYNIEFFDPHNFYIGDNLKIVGSDSVEKESEVTDVISAKSITIRGQGQLNSALSYIVTRDIRKTNSSDYAYLNVNSANVQNTYQNPSKDVLIASQSLPSYNQINVNPYSKKVTLNGTFSGTSLQVISNADHGFYTGDKVYYSPGVITNTTFDSEGNSVLTTTTSKFPELTEGLYYVKRVSSTNISLSKSQSSLAEGNFISVSGTVTNNVIQLYEFANKTLAGQNILREIKKPVNKSGNYETIPGKVGVLINGVEILNYKSPETVFYGKIESLQVGAGGTGYDVINPPSLEITDSQGIGATSICAVTGSLEDIRIIDPGFDYLDKPQVVITGGNGRGASAEVNMKSVDHIVSFESDASDRVNLTTDVIGFSTYHKFRDFEKVVYLTDSQSPISGLTTNSSYYVSVVDGFNIKLHTKEGDAIAGINTINLTDYGSGIHRIKSSSKKQIISNILVKDSGQNYQNRERTCSISGVSTSLGSISIGSHGYSDGEELTYSTTGSAISGLVTTSTYLVKKIDDDSFRLSPVGLGTTSKTYYLETEQFVDFKSQGSGVHSFNYTPIVVSVLGNIGISTLSNQDFSAIVQPIFRGTIDSVHLTSNGSNYGSSEVINYNRQPNFNLRSGKDAQLSVVANEGKIVEILVLNGGSGYNSPPNLLINGSGSYARLTPIIENGQIVEVKIINGGINYTNNTTIDVIPAGENCRLIADIQKWTINLFEKNYETITADDGIVTESDRNNNTLQYCHLYAPRKLRELIYAKNSEGTLYGVHDLRKANNEEIASTQHSPIIGWAYDGNPIYGPYGYSTPTGGSIKALSSGYKLVTKTNRPPVANFPQGFFNEDYEFYADQGDLDEHNGRFCITPDYPNGVYAYFSTINSSTPDTDGPFKAYKRPTFPYFIGNSFYSQPNDFNYKETSNQDDYNLNNYEWFRNTSNYRLKGSENSSYNFIFDPDSVKNQIVDVTYATSGKVDSIGISTGGSGYQVNDKVVFDSVGTGGINAAAKIERVFGKSIYSVSAATTSFADVEFQRIDGVGQVVGFATVPHGFTDTDIVNVSGFSTYFSQLDGSYSVGIKSDSFVTALGIGTTGTTGIATYFYVTGLLGYPYIRENDILQIGTGTPEKVKVLNVEANSGRIRVLREVESTVGSSYSASTVLYENPRKFRFNSGLKTDFGYPLNKELYFNPSESLGIGTAASAGIGTTVTFSSPGIGATQTFVPFRSIFIQDHGLLTGEKVRYSSNGGTAIRVYNGSSSSSLSQTQDLYVANISKDLIGISTVKVGLGSTGSFVGVGSTTPYNLLFFESFGTNTYHSFTTKRQSVKGEISKNVVTVATASTHGLALGDTIKFVSEPKNTETISVRYSDANRRILFRPQTFTSGNVSVLDDTIEITDHGLKTGDKVIHTSASPSGGLLNEKIYYVLYYTKDKVRLCNSRYELGLSVPKFVDITSADSGTLSLVNPRLELYKNKLVKFDLSDPSLSFTSGSSTYSCFRLDFYKDSQFKYPLTATGTSRNFEISREGKVGIETSFTSVSVNKEFPEIFYYKFNLVNEDFIGTNKKEIIVDTDVANNNQINLVESVYSGEHKLTGIGSTTFVFNLSKFPEQNSYSSSTSNLFYDTASTSVYGPVSKVRITNPGRNYEISPAITRIISGFGTGAILNVSSTSIGQIVRTEVKDIGFDYPSDFTLSPSLNLPEILIVDPLASFERIGISSAGNNYVTPPGLVVLDGYTNKVVTDVDLRFELGAPEVKILKNTFGIYNATPIIIPVNNSNGVGISSVNYNSSTKEVTIGFSTGFSDIFPFAVGDRVLIENVSVGVGSTSKGYNSSNYGYDLFTITEVNPALGGNVGEIKYNLTTHLSASETPGTFDPTNSSGRIVAEKDFPYFDISLRKNNFNIGEEVTSTQDPNKNGFVESWNNKVETVKLSSPFEFELNEEIRGVDSNTIGVIKSKFNFESYVKLGAYASVNKGWRYTAGFLNDTTQRIPDNNYYQQFSYSLKSKVPVETWEDSVSSLNHTSGFLKFSDLVIETKEDVSRGVVFADDSSISITADIIGEGNLNCVYTFDLATENSKIVGSSLVSDEIKFKNRIITDYFESTGNRVLLIDDISNLFNSDPRTTPFSIVDEFSLDNSRTKKYFTLVRDKRYTHERQTLLVSLLHDGSYGYLNQYGRVASYPDLGSFDFTITGTTGQLLFYPNKFTINDYNVAHVSHDLREAAGIGSTTLGDVVQIDSAQTTFSSGATAASSIVGIASTYRSSKIIVEIGGVDGSYYEFDEINMIHNGSEIDIIDYGQLTDEILTPTGTPGLGTYIPRYDGSEIRIDFKPDSALGVGVTINVLAVSIASSISGATGVGTQQLNNGRLSSAYATIAASGSPGVTTITQYPDDHLAAYYIVSIEDKTNQRYQMSEVIVISAGSTASITEYGILETDASLGTIDANVVTGGTDLTFTPIADIDVDVRVFQQALCFDRGITDTEISFTNALISSGFGDYEGTERSVKREFNLTHNSRNIFQRDFDGSNTSIANTSTNTIELPEHFFVTGEKLLYTYSGSDSSTANAVGIATTSISGIGNTDKLPTTVYAVKVSEKTIKLAASAEDALKVNPVVLDLTSVGIGTSHVFTATNQNAKALISIDNYIQSPIVASAVTTTISEAASTADNRLKFAGITSFFGGDLIKVNDEIMRIDGVGIGSTNVILVKRPWMGTVVANHAANSVVTKIEGNYNIVNNTLHFVEAPQGPTPIGSITNRPDQRDYTGLTTYSTFHGRTFMRSGIVGTTTDSYSANYVFDDISDGFTGIAKTFTLTSNKQNVTGFSTDNAIVLINGIFQGPQGTQAETQDYTLTESSGITSVRFTGTASSVGYDINASNVPVGGVLVSVASTEGFGLQPLVAAGGTAVVSAAGTISSISIGNSGSGYRIGIQTVVNVGVQTSSTGTANIEFIGTASVSNGRIVSVAITNPGVGYTRSNPPTVVIDSPLSYSNISLIYSSSSVSGVGTQAKVDIVVGQGSSVIDFTIRNTGYGYGQGEILTIQTGGNIGIPTDTTKTFKEFQITVDKVYNDNFSGWSVGQLQVLDSFESLFDGTSKSFPLKLNGGFITIRAANGSNIDIKSTLLIFINDILQVPGQAYTFEGGSSIEFTESPKKGDTARILFYKGSGDTDVIFKDIIETVKVGDELTLQNDPGLGQGIGLLQDTRVITGINTSDSVTTNPYSGPGITTDDTLLRPLKWCRQTKDKFINGIRVGKDRVKYEPQIYPASLLISSTGIGSTSIYVDSIRPFFDARNENSILTFQDKVKLTSQDSLVGASATATVSAAGTITSITITDGGFGYSSAPIVTIETPVGIATTERASATATISSGVVDAISVTGPGTGYTSTNPPAVLIEPPTLKQETIDVSSFSGDSGTIVGFGTTSSPSEQMTFDLFIPLNSYLRNTVIAGTALTISGISTGDYFVVYNSNVGSSTTSTTSFDNGSQVIGVGTQFVDNVYQVSSFSVVSVANTSIGLSTVGTATTEVIRVSAASSTPKSFSGITTAPFLGEYSWGKINLSAGVSTTFSNHTSRGVGGLSTSTLVNRSAFLKFKDYTA